LIEFLGANHDACGAELYDLPTSETARAKQYGIAAKEIPMPAEAACCGAPLAPKIPKSTTMPPRTQPIIVITQANVFISFPRVIWRA
jgi:hypothetical protein